MSSPPKLKLKAIFDELCVRLDFLLSFVVRAFAKVEKVFGEWRCQESCFPVVQKAGELF